VRIPKKERRKFQPAKLARTPQVVLPVISNYLKAALVEGINR
jgi:hypothetical protein